MLTCALNARGFEESRRKHWQKLIDKNLLKFRKQKLNFGSRNGSVNTQESNHADRIWVKLGRPECVMRHGRMNTFKPILFETFILCISSIFDDIRSAN